MGLLDIFTRFPKLRFTSSITLKLPHGPILKRYQMVPSCSHMHSVV